MTSTLTYGSDRIQLLPPHAPVPEVATSQEAQPAPASLCLPRSFALRLLQLGWKRAISLGLPPEDAEDCAASFAGHISAQLLAESRSALPPDLDLTSAAGNGWLVRCADNWARTRRKQVLVRSWREAPWSVLAGHTSLAEYVLVRRAAAPDETAEARLLRQEVRVRLLTAVSRLKPPQQELFLRRFVQERSIEEIAAEYGRTQEAVRYAVWALRRRLRVLLERQGFGEEDAREYLHALAGSMRAPPG